MVGLSGRKGLMKIAAWIGAFLAVALLAFVLGGRDERMSAKDARTKIVALSKAPGLRLTDTKKFAGDSILGGKIEKRTRDLLHINRRETPSVIEDYHFRDSSGGFTIQLLDREGEPAEIRVYGGAKASKSMGELLRTTFPEADFVDKP
jgi:hypothetical protein